MNHIYLTRRARNLPLSSLNRRRAMIPRPVWIALAAVTLIPAIAAAWHILNR